MSTEKIQELDVTLLVTLQILLREKNVTHTAKALSLSQSALSGRLSRLREIFNNPLLVASTSGRGMVATDLALQLEPEINGIINQLQHLLSPRSTFIPAQADRTFVIAMPENPATMLLPDLIPIIRGIAPGIKIACVLPDREKIYENLEQGQIDLLIDSESNASADWKTRPLLDEHFATAQRIGHPRGAHPFDLEEYCAMDHLLISASGGGFSGLVDNKLAELGRSRLVSVSVQSYALAPLILKQSDCICTLPRRLLAQFGNGLDVFAPPLELPPFKVSMYWHQRSQDDTGHRWLREQIIRAAHDRQALQ